IKRLVEQMDPRGYVVHPIGAPDPAELSQHYLQRFWTRLPGKGSITIFDRSWYGRVLVERVEKISPRADWQRAYDEIRQFEKMLTDDGVILIKILIHISKREQGERFRARLEKPHKRWKITMADFKTREHWAAYQRAFNDMISKTSTEAAPWLVAPGDVKRATRPYVLSHCKQVLAQSLQQQRVRFLTPEIKAAAKTMFDLDLS
ncbi:polyphosphate kinase, partial [bacterium]|nr:polyphosphate kinase [bacterium]